MCSRTWTRIVGLNADQVAAAKSDDVEGFVKAKDGLTAITAQSWSVRPRRPASQRAPTCTRASSFERSGAGACGTEQRADRSAFP